ncbi:uncharacterized protein LOC142771998 isoform X2 [Rhipicephalus microplus]|uniref:uncharacterized protein LOC142771998 isoform X2 n=1 Tax=Rhipicephalus microplus TaxID=6941 RepID=UPI003F6BBB34
MVAARLRNVPRRIEGGFPETSFVTKWNKHGQAREYAGCPPLQFAQCESWTQSSAECSFELHFTQVWRPWQL